MSFFGLTGNVSTTGFTKGKSYLTNLLAFYDGMTTSVDKERATDVICLHICKAFYTGSENIFLTKLERCGFGEWYLVDNELTSWCIQGVMVNGHSMCFWRSAMGGAPWGVCTGTGIVWCLHQRQRKWDWVHPQQLCRWHQAEWCSRHMIDG